MAFAKKVQVGGVMAGRRMDEVTDNVFKVSGRINSTWGGGLVDMVRSRRLLELIERDGLIESAAETGEWFVKELQALQEGHDNRVTNARGRGLMCAIDVPDPRSRDHVVGTLREDERVLVLPGGERSIRFRPSLCASHEDLQYGLDALDRALGGLGRMET